MMLRKLVVVLLPISLIIGIQNSAYCQAVTLEHNGKAGTWLPDEMAKEVLADVAELDATKLLVVDLKSQTVLKQERIDIIKEALDASEKAEKRAIQELDTAFKARDEAEKKLKIWYRHPAFWITMGVVITVGLEVGAIKLIQAVD